jgi:hypothetical protein
MSGSNLSDASVPRADAPHDDQPLGLTVHSMPTPQQLVAGDPQRTLRGRWKMIAVLLVCAAPVVASYFTYYVVRPEGRRNFGELVDPQRPLPNLPAARLDGGTVNLQALRGQWLFVSVAGGACDAACERHLYLQRQLREGLGKEKDRVDWVWLVNDAAPVPPALQAALKNATVLRVPADALAQWLVPTPGRQLPDQLYLVDPIGNWMMRFPPVNKAPAGEGTAGAPTAGAARLAGPAADIDTASAARIKRDIERVLRASASWDDAGRVQK